MAVDKMEVIYYEMLKMEDRLTQKAIKILEAEDKISNALNRFEILQKEFILKMEESSKH
jgi:hypothetical protein